MNPQNFHADAHDTLARVLLIIAAIILPTYILHTHWIILDLAIIPWGIYYLIFPARPNIRWVYLGGVAFTTVFTCLDVLSGVPFLKMALFQHIHVVCFSAAYVALNLLLRYGGRQFLFFTVVFLASSSINAYFRGERLAEEDGIMALAAWQYSLKCRWGHCLAVLPSIALPQRRWLVPLCFPLIGVFMIFVGDARMLGCVYIVSGASYYFSKNLLSRLSFWSLLLVLVPALLLGGIAANELFLKTKIFGTRIGRYEQSNQERLDMGQLAWERIQKRPVTGYGSGQDGVAVYRPVVGFLDSQVHGFPLGLTLQYGMAGLLYAVVLIAIGIAGLCAFVACAFKCPQLELRDGFPFFMLLLLAFLARCFTSVYKIELAGVYGLSIGFALFCLFAVREMTAKAVEAGSPVGLPLPADVAPNPATRRCGARQHRPICITRRAIQPGPPRTKYQRR